MKYPDTRKIDFSYDIHGSIIEDPYQWLEDEKNPEVVSWAKKQNTILDTYIKDAPVDEVYDELVKDLDVSTRSLPYRRGDMYFWNERDPGMNHAVKYCGDTPADKNKRVVFDPNVLSDDGSISPTFFAISLQGDRAVYGLQKSGAERSDIYIRDLTTGEDTHFYFGRTFSMSWDLEGTGFYYTRSDYLNHGGDIKDETHYQQIYFHRIGEERNEDTLLFDAVEQGLPIDAGIGAHDDDKGRFVAVNASIGWHETHGFLVDTVANTISKIKTPKDAKTYLRILEDGYIYATTNHNANNKKVLRCRIEDASKPFKDWEEYIAEKPGHLLEGWGVSKSRIIANYFHKVTSKPILLDRKTGKSIKELDIPEIASFSALSCSRYHEEFFYAFATFFSSSTHYRFDPDAEQSQLLWESPLSIDTDSYSAVQEWYTSKDGTKVPMFIVEPKNAQRNGDNPVLLTAYGGYGYSRRPGYIGGNKPWIKRNGIYALANIRGGGEFGEDWHKAGVLERKQNCFDDLAAAAEHLISTKRTNPKRLGIRGGSNGGLLVAATMLQRPELFGAVLCEVPVLDMYRYHKFLLAYRWTHEWGNPEKSDEFAWLEKYSPYHNIESRKYPPVLLTAGINDSRVHPMNAWKMGAKLQAANPDNITLIKTDMGAGHGSGKGFYKAVRDQAESLAFLIKTTM